MKNCETYQTYIDAYIEGHLDGNEQALLEEHIQSCTACRNEWRHAQSLSLVINESFCPKQSEQLAVDTVLSSISQTPIRCRPSIFVGFGKIAASVLIAASLLLSFWAGRTSLTWDPASLVKTSYTIKELQGTVLVKHANTDIWQPVTINTLIYNEDQFLSTPDGSVVFAVDEQSSIELKANSMLTLNINADETNLHLVHGMLDADLESPHGPFFVTTPHGRAEALGTEFTVKVD